MTDDTEYKELEEKLIEDLKLSKKKKKKGPKEKPLLLDLDVPQIENGSPEEALSPSSPPDGEIAPILTLPTKKPSKRPAKPALLDEQVKRVTIVVPPSEIAIIAKYEKMPKKKKRRRNDISFDNVEITKILTSMGLDNTGNISESNQTSSLSDNYDANQPYAYNDKEYLYEELLARVFALNPKKGPAEKKKIVIKPPHVVRIGARTSFVNFKDTCKALHRQPKHVLSYLIAELGAFGAIDGNNQLIIKGRFNGAQIESVLRGYIKEYVTCHTCKSPDSVLQKDLRLYFLQCETCGSRCAVNNIKQGYVAPIYRRAN